MAIYFKWTKEMSVGNEIIDSQHKRLLSQVNEIINALAFGVNSNQVKSALDFFDQYITEHFKFEEEYMKEMNFPDLDEHIKYHQDFVQKYFDFKEKFSQIPPEELILEIEEYLGNWWIEHIGKEDKKYYLFANR